MKMVEPDVLLLLLSVCLRERLCSSLAAASRSARTCSSSSRQSISQHTRVRNALLWGCCVALLCCACQAIQNNLDSNFATRYCTALVPLQAHTLQLSLSLPYLIIQVIQPVW